jgi:hypothetical protein
MTQEHWVDFAEEDAETIVIKIKAKLQEWNDEHRDMPFPMINWLPAYGGVVSEQTPFPSYDQLSYMQEHNIPYYLTGEPISLNRK